ncbi:hypothetical protein HMPREF0758_3641 [Serratia odorifera DSM 4582]|uniref:Uncharacterized protein n=1 Tax=Serratia odorifera DSM 4582 TaxID=667129 RepID=D4E641_SEROD|nr:hypothetical protein HMPREF0758_3641 [Serratia odorifera DSM 4582]
MLLGPIRQFLHKNSLQTMTHRNFSSETGLESVENHIISVGYGWQSCGSHAPPAHKSYGIVNN